MEYGFSVALGIQREKGYVLIPGLKTSRVAPILNIGMSAPSWIKFLTSYGYHNKFDFENPGQFNDMVFNRKHGVIFQGLKWRLQDPKDPTGFGIGITKLNKYGILVTTHPERNIRDVSYKLRNSTRKDAIDSFNFAFNQGVISRVKRKDVLSSFDSAANLREPLRSYEVASIFLDTIKNCLKDNPN